MLAKLTRPFDWWFTNFVYEPGRCGYFLRKRYVDYKRYNSYNMGIRVGIQIGRALAAQEAKEKGNEL